jgi:hypothetical protein
MIGALPGIIASSLISGEISPADYGTLLVDVDPANASVTGGKVTSVAVGYGSYVFSQSVDANRPTYTATDSDFNNQPSIQFSSSDLWLSSNTVTIGNSIVTLVIIGTLGGSGGAVIVGTTPDGNAVAKSLEVIHGGTNVRSFTSGENVATAQRNRNVSSTTAKLYYAMSCDFSVAGGGTDRIKHYQNGIEEATSLGFDNSPTAGTPATASTWYVGHRGSGGFIFEGKIARILGYAGTVDHLGLYTDYLLPLFG